MEAAMHARAGTMAAAIALLLACSPADGVTIGTTDTFSGGTTLGWFAGGGPFGAVPPTPPHVVATGGPGGVGDAFLQVTASGGAGPGSRLVAMNAAQWAGSYLAAGVGAIAMDVRNLGPADLFVRLLFEDPIPGPPANIAISSVGFALPAGGAWTHVSFDLNDLTALMGNVATLLANTTLIRIIHAPTAVFPPEPVAGVLGIDNIAAAAGPVAVDEPASAWLIAAAALALAVRLRRRGR
jgi:hypothetical protein